MATTTYFTRFCRYCRSAMVGGFEPSGDPCLECPNCLHSVELSTVEDSTLDLQAVASDLAAAAQRQGDTVALAAINRAAYYAAQGVTPIPAARDWLVPSGTRGGIVHRVTLLGCSCEAGARGRLCWHKTLVNMQGVC